MKLVISLALILTSLSLHGQNTFPKIERLEVYDKVLRGKLGDDAITIYLKFHQYNRYHAGTYSVKGWYAIDESPDRTELVGFYHLGDLFLYHFLDGTDTETLLKFTKNEVDRMGDMKFYKTMEGYKEKFTLTDGTSNWQNDDKRLEVQLQTNDFAIRQTHEFLQFDAYHAFDLSNLGMWHWNFEIVAQSGKKLVLKYEHPSKRYGAGRCAAGTESGLVFVEFNQDNSFVSSQSFILESCLFSIEYQEQNPLPNDVVEYHCQNFLDGDSYVLQIDNSNAEIVKLDKK